MLAMKRTKRRMEQARSYIHNYTLGEEAERARYLQSDERLLALSAQLDELRARRNALNAALAGFPNNGFQL